MNNQNLHIHIGGNTLHYSQIVGYVLNRGQNKTNKTSVCIILMNDTQTMNTWVCVISMNNTENVIPGYAMHTMHSVMETKPHGRICVIC